MLHSTTLQFKRALGMLLFTAVAIAVAASAGQAQISRLSSYTFSTFTGSYSSINTVGTYLTYGDDSYTTFTLPFAFNYDSVNYPTGSTVGVTTNGQLRIGAAGDCCSRTIQGNSSYPNYILPFQYDGYVRTGIYYYVTGSSPNQVLTVEYKYYTYWTVSSPSVDMEVKLYESTNVIEFLYSSHGGSAYTTGYVGLNGNNTPTFQSILSLSGSTIPSADYRYTPRLNSIPSRVTYSPRSLDFSFVNTGNSNTLCATVTALPNLGPVVVQAVSLAGVPDYSIVSGSLKSGDTIPSGTSRQICVRFAPIAAGTRTSSLSIGTNALDSGNITINLTGVGVAPAITIADPGLFRKSRVRIGDSLTQCFTVNSTGTGPLTINSVTVTGANPDQYVVSSMPTLIPAGGTGTICITYKPSYEGRPDAQIVVNSNAINTPTLSFQTFGVGVIPHFSFLLADSTLRTTATLSFDSVSIGQTVCKTQTIVNTGSDTLAILKNYQSSGDYDFLITPMTGTDTLIAPGQSKSIRICFTPLSQGLRVATVRFLTNLPRTFPRPGQDTSQFSLAIEGTGVPFGQFSIRGTAVDTGIIGIQTCFPDTLVNTGSASLTITDWSITGPDASEFTVTGATLPFTLATGQSKVVTVCLTPTQRGSRTAAISAVGTSAGTPLSVTLPLLGYGLSVCAQASPTQAFTTTPVMVGTTETATVTVTNCGDVATTYTAALQQPGTEYTVAPAQSATVAPTGTATFTVTYTPSKMGTATGTLHITGGTQVTPMDVSLNAVGGGVTASALNVNAGDVPVGTCKDVTMTVNNTGNVDWTPGSATVTGAYSYVSLTPSTIAAGSTGTLTVKFCPTALGPTSTSVTFPAASPAPIGGFSATITGRGVTNGVAEITTANGFSLGQNYPNPVAGKSDIRYTAPSDVLVRIELLDLTGHLVQTLEDGRVGSGEHTVTLDSKSLASGTYYYVLTSGTTRLVRQLTVTK